MLTDAVWALFILTSSRVVAQELTTVIEYDRYTFYGKCPVQPRLDILSDSIWAKPRSVETFWCQEVTWSSRCLLSSLKRPLLEKFRRSIAGENSTYYVEGNINHEKW